MAADVAEDLYPNLNQNKGQTVNESSPLQIKNKEQKQEKESQYRSVSIQAKKQPKKYENEEKCLANWLSCCWILMTSIIPIAEIIVLIYFFRNDAYSLCPLQQVWTYFILAKLIFEIVTVSLFAGFTFLNCGKDSHKAIGLISFVWLLIWDVVLSVELFRYTKEDTTDIKQKDCDLLIDFILFEAVSVWAVISLLLCIGCWWYSHDLVISAMSVVAHVMHSLVTTVTLSVFYQWVMSVVEIVFLAIYYHDYGDCNPLYGKYVLAKFVFTVVIIGCTHLLECGESNKIKEKRRGRILTFLYILGLIVWCVASSVIFWSEDAAGDVECRTNEYTAHFFDFIMLDIILGYVVIATLLCRVCWVQLSEYLGSPKVVEKYGKFASSNTAEWLRYKESQQKK